VSRPTGYRWRRRFQQAGTITAVVEHSRRHEHSPSQTAAESEARVVSLQSTGGGAKKLAVLLHEESRALPVITINRILKQRGLVTKWGSYAQHIFGQL